MRDGEVRLDGSVSLDEFVASVVALPGLGDWTAQYLALRLGEADAFPAGDLGLRKALGERGGADRPGGRTAGRGLAPVAGQRRHPPLGPAPLTPTNLRWSHHGSVV